MKPEVFRAALEATARVACCAALIGSVGCQPKKTQQIDPKPSVEEKQIEEKTETNLIEETLEDPRAAMIKAAKEKADPRFIACQEKVAEHLKNETNADPNQPWPEEVVECCDIQAKAVDADGDLGILFERQDCCDALGWQGSLACTPWGPPTPPKMV